MGSRGLVAGTIAALALIVAPRADGLTFAAPQSYGVFGNPFQVVTADLNGDGHPDLVAAVSSFSGVVTSLVGDGLGSFAAPKQVQVGTSAYGVTVADFDGDGKLDVAVASQNGSNQVNVLLGRGNGTFLGPGNLFPAAPIAVAIASGRFSGGTLPDIVTASSSANQISFLGNATLTPGTPQFSFAVPFAGGHSAESLAVADFNRDGVPDVAAADFSETGQTSGYTILDGTGNPSGFGTPTFTALGSDLTQVLATDLNGDGYPDLVLVDPGSRVYVLLNDGHGNFGPTTSYDVVTGLGQPLPRLAAAGDIERTGHPDLVIEENVKGEPDLLILHNQGNGTFTPLTRIPARGIGDSLTIADLNGDGAPDILEGNAAGTVDVLMNVGQAQPSPSSLSFGSVVAKSHSAPRAISIKNVGAAPMTIEGLALVGSSPGSFDLDDPLLGGPGTCTGAALAAGASCTAFVSFRPTGLGPASGALRVFTNTGSAPVDIPLGGSGLLSLRLAPSGHPHPGTRRVAVSASCSAPCQLRLSLSVSKATARHLHLKHTLLASAAKQISATGTVTLRLGKTVARALSRPRSVSLSVAGTASAGTQRASAHITLKLRR